MRLNTRNSYRQSIWLCLSFRTVQVTVSVVADFVTVLGFAKMLTEWPAVGFSDHKLRVRRDAEKPGSCSNFRARETFDTKFLWWAGITQYDQMAGTSSHGRPMKRFESLLRGQKCVNEKWRCVYLMETATISAIYLKKKNKENGIINFGGASPTALSYKILSPWEDRMEIGSIASEI